jgi:hypothetical protein
MLLAGVGCCKAAIIVHRKTNAKVCLGKIGIGRLKILASPANIRAASEGLQ